MSRGSELAIEMNKLRWANTTVAERRAVGKRLAAASVKARRARKRARAVESDAKAS